MSNPDVLDTTDKINININVNHRSIDYTMKYKGKRQHCVIVNITDQ